MEMVTTENGEKTPRLSKVNLTWNTNTALAVIVVGSMLVVAGLRGSLSKGGAVQP